MDDVIAVIDRLGSAEIVRTHPELSDIPQLVADMFRSEDLGGGQRALQAVATELLASGSVHSYAGTVLAPVCEVAWRLDPRLQVDFWALIAEVTGRMTQPASRSAHESLRPHATAFLESADRRDNPLSGASCAVAAVAVAYPDWGRLATPLLARTFDEAPLGSAIMGVIGLGLIGVGVCLPRVVEELERIRTRTAGSDLTRSFSRVLQPLDDPDTFAEDVLDAMHECALGFWGNLTPAQLAGAFQTA